MSANDKPVIARWPRAIVVNILLSFHLPKRW